MSRIYIGKLYIEDGKIILNQTIQDGKYNPAEFPFEFGSDDFYSYLTKYILNEPYDEKYELMSNCCTSKDVAIMDLLSKVKK